jgi:hypothetical protein
VSDVLDSENSLRYGYSVPQVRGEALSESQTIRVRADELTKTIDIPTALRTTILAQPEVLPLNPSKGYILDINGVVAPRHRSALIHMLRTFLILLQK